MNCVRHCAANLVHIKLESMGGLKILAFFEGDAGTHVTGGVDIQSGAKKNQPAFVSQGQQDDSKIPDNY